MIILVSLITITRVKYRRANYYFVSIISLLAIHYSLIQAVGWLLPSLLVFSATLFVFASGEINLITVHPLRVVAPAKQQQLTNIDQFKFNQLISYLSVQ